MKMKHGVGAAMVAQLGEAVKPAFEVMGLAHALITACVNEKREPDTADKTALAAAQLAGLMSMMQMQMQTVASLAGIGDMLAELVEVQVPEPPRPFEDFDASQIGEPFHMAVEDLPAFLELANEKLNAVFAGGARVIGDPTDPNAIGFAIKVEKLPGEFVTADGAPDHAKVVAALKDVLAEAQKPFERSAEDADKINAAAGKPLHSDQPKAEPKASPGAINVDGPEGTQ